MFVFASKRIKCKITYHRSSPYVENYMKQSPTSHNTPQTNKPLVPTFTFGFLRINPLYQPEEDKERMWAEHHDVKHHPECAPRIREPLISVLTFSQNTIGLKITHDIKCCDRY